MRFIQISDLHVHGSMEHEDNRNCVTLVEYICRHYDRDEEKPVVLVTGDITDDGKANQYKNAVTILRPLVKDGFKVLAVPGNHDYGPWGNIYTEAAQARFQRYILHKLLRHPKAGDKKVKMEQLYPIEHVAGDIAFIGLDSVVANEDEWLHFASGEVGKPQRKALRNLLHKHRDKSRKIVVFFHHHPFDRSYVMKLDDAERVMRLLAARVDFLCFGHDHRSQVWPALNDIDWIMACGKSTRRNARYKLQFREASIDGDDNRVTMVSFR